MKNFQFDFKNRIQKLRDFLCLKKQKAVLFTDLKDIFYFSGFKGSKAFLLITGDKEFLITDFRYFEKVDKDGCYGELFKVKSSYFDDTAGFIFSLKIKEIVLDEAKTTCEIYNELTSRLPETSFSFQKNISNEIRGVKEKEEIEIIKEGALKTSKVFEKALSFLTKGITEKSFALILEDLLKKEGFENVSFPPIVLFGKNSSMPHGESGNTPLDENQAVLVDFGGIYKGYCTDFTRTLFFGNPDSSFIHIYSKLLNCQKTVIDKARTGMKAFQVDAIGRECLDSVSLGEFFQHSLGHGVGLEIHESPMVSPFSDIVIENGMVFTVEPGVYFENRFGIRIEDMVVVENDRLNVLTDFPKELILIKQE
ncbi:Xaa-Pro aminopeptidase [Thermotomaculum hydrothermale]|uniref:Xaa-Pro aminopeptidase n=1 Tax=Thermotomaculum hydrothermale TaxID=981385 RepID=A0A7R6PYC1_9BACT|nr:aminopeptidase P family protein [Thermotomaculum hydrothermale]BBB31858.1 Xaa-Pro aminopeptidase [Thermotomaculum hydrothermale]